MLIDSSLVPEAVIKPRSFAGLMTLYESNYLRLLRLVPELPTMDGCYRSRVVNECDLYFEIIDSSRYTVTASLTYRFGLENGAMLEPDITVRAYTDGQQAEVLSIGAGPEHDRLRQLVAGEERELDRRWHHNIILNKWLEYLSNQGHLILDR